MVNKKKRYKTRSGFQVKIKKVTRYYIYGLIHFPDTGWADSRWFIDGDYRDDFEESSLDLIEVKDVK
jgi:hypothetical protein